MSLKLLWHPSIDLGKLSDRTLALARECIEEMDSFPGVYVFGRQHGSNFDPVYVGKAQSIRLRLRQQMNNFQLMTALGRSGTGSKKILIGQFLTGRGLRLPDCLALLEKALLEHALTSGAELINIQGTKLRFRTIASSGKRRDHVSFPRRMNVRI